MHISTGRAEIATQTDLEGGEWSEEKILIARPPTNVGNSTPTTVTTSRQSSVSDTVEQQADARMRTPPPPPQPLQSATEEEEGEEIEGAQDSTPSSTIDYSDGFGLFLINDLNDFIVELTYHSAWCGGMFELEKIDFKDGAGITEKWKCCSCHQQYTHQNCNWIRTDIVEEGRRNSRSQPEINIRIVKAAREVGINFEKLTDFLAKLGVKASAYKNILHQERKVRQAIEELAETRLKENMREHVLATRNSPNYVGDIIWEDEQGNIHHTAQGHGSFDGAGLTRAYQHRIKGSRSAFIVYSLLTKKPIMKIYYSVREHKYCVVF